MGVNAADFHAEESDTCAGLMLKTLRYIWSHPLARRSRFAAIGRYFRWQIGSRLVRAPVILPFVHESVLAVERSMTGATGNVYCGLHEFADMAFLLHLMRSEDTFIDVGANVGSYSVLACAVVGARSITIEPVLGTFRRLERNLRVNAIEARVEAIRCIVGRAEGQIRFSVDRDTMNRVVSDDYPGESELLPVKTMDDLLYARDPILWKVDVEGFEEEVLSGAGKSLRNPKLLAVLLEGDSPEIRATMTSAGFIAARYDPFSRVLSEWDAVAESDRFQNNNLWVRDLAEVRARCGSARRFTVLNSQF
jgi:FkbM family methyltransferase